MPEGTGRATILVADDNAGHRKILEMVLSAHNYDVVCAEDGHEALTYLQAHTPDAVILDVDMPFMSGIDVCDRAKRVSRLRGVPIIIMTSLTDERTALMAKQARADRLVHKPLSGKNIQLMLSDLLGGAGTERAR